MLRVSLNEIFRVCQRALEGLGAPDGIDRDGAAAVAWLEARGLPGLATLARDLPRLGNAFGSILASKSSDGGHRIDAQGRPAIAIAGCAIDYLQSLSRPEVAVTLTIDNLRSPLFLLPAAAARAELGERYQIEWPTGNEPGCAALLDQAGATIALARDNDDRATTARLTVDPTFSMVVPVNGKSLTPALLAARMNDRLANGVSADEQAWRAIGAVAARVLVPATSESRVRGAGGGDANE